MGMMLHHALGHAPPGNLYSGVRLSCVPRHASQPRTSRARRPSGVRSPEGGERIEMNENAVMSHVLALIDYSCSATAPI